MLSRGFPAEGDPGEYTMYFEKIFGEDKEKQRQYLAAILAEDKVTLSVGSRVLAALLATGQSRAIFTTNFDTVLERAVAEVSGRSLSAYHLEGAQSANKALNSEEYPLYCKLHGDFRYDSIKNLKSDVASQNADLSQCLTNAANRFGFIVAGYSGRDESVMDLLRSVLSTTNPFPHGLYWTGMKNGWVAPAVQRLIDEAKQGGVNAAIVEVETFDALMLRLWRNIESKDPTIDAKVRKSHRTKVSIAQPQNGKGLIDPGEVRRPRLSKIC
jgi:SIR2-like domain